MKFLKYLFTVPEGEKVTDRHLKRVLISSVCGIFLCMCGLVGTTWAWYTATVESAPISMQIAMHNVQLRDMDNNELENPVTVTPEATVKLTAEFFTDAQPDERNLTPGRYIRIEVQPASGGEVTKLYVQTVKNEQGQWLAKLELTTDEACIASFYSVWQAPEGADVLDPGTIKLITVTNKGDASQEGEEPVEGEESVEGENTEQTAGESTEEPAPSN